MKALKIIGVVLVIILAILLVLGLFAPKDYHVERSTVINAPKAVVFWHVQYWKNWQAWSPWAEMDSTQVVTVEGKDGQIGSMYKWKGEKVGSGEMTNTGVKPGEQMDFHLHFIEPMESETKGYVKVVEAEGGVKTNWAFFGEMKFPWNVVGLFYSMDKMVGKDFEHGLALLKALAEKDARRVGQYQVQTIDYPARTYAGIEETISMQQVKDFYTRNFPAAYGKLMQQKIKMAGAPSGLYYSWDEATGMTRVAAAIAIAPGRKPKDLQLFEIPAGKAYVIDYYGPYEQVMYAYWALDKYMAANSLQPAMPAIEEYLTDPDQEPDPNKRLTRIYFFAN